MIDRQNFPVEEPTETDWAYLAGLIDGEGSLALVHRKGGDRTRPDNVYPYRSDNSYQCYVTISNTDLKMIDWVRYTFNGCVYFSREREGNRKRQYTVSWQASDMVKWILSNCLPYMLTKYDVAESILHFLEVPQWEKELRKFRFKEFKEMKEQTKITVGGA